jgi:hypothetical protein
LRGGSVIQIILEQELTKLHNKLKVQLRGILNVLNVMPMSSISKKVAQFQGFAFLAKPRKEEKDVKAGYVFDFRDDP